MSSTFYTGTNRVQRAIDDIRTRVDGLEPDARADLDSNLDLGYGEHFAYQTAQSRAHASGRLNVDEALLVYNALGEVGSSSNGGWASGTDTATKVAVTLLMGEILQ
jgi:hypothetical protein